MAAWLSLATVPGAWAQAPAARRDPVQAPLLLSLPTRTALSQRPVPALSPAQMKRVQEAAELRDAGLTDRAREMLTALLSKAPHHPLVLSELARTHLARQDFAAVERLGRSERLAQKDSLLLGRELALALERLGRPRNAAQVALEMWAASPAQADWASGTLLRLVGADPHGIHESLRRASDRLPARLDIASGLAQIEWRIGDTREALRTLTRADHAGLGPAPRSSFAEELIGRSTSRDSSGALEVLLDLAGDSTHDVTLRLISAHRAWEICLARQAERDGAPRVAQALEDLPPSKWPADLLAGVARGLRRAGMTDEARALIKARGDEARLSPELALERALADLKDGPPEKALPFLAAIGDGSPEARFRHAEALFFAGQADSALAHYQRIARDPRGAFAGAAFERIYLIEEAEPRDALSIFGRLAYEEWRGETRRATALADSLYRILPRGPSWAQAALMLSGRLEAAGDARGSLAPLLAVADSLPGDRLAPLARQRAGDIYLLRLKDDAHALEQYEECLARYPRAWNAPEVRRKLETLRQERRF
jgi:tetratricopeptide (TPR) repeat protein